jgi:hypothetical protein
VTAENSDATPEPKASRAAKAESARAAKQAQTTKAVDDLRQQIGRAQRENTAFVDASKAQEESEDIALSESRAPSVNARLDELVSLYRTDSRAAAEGLVALLAEEDAWCMQAIGRPIELHRLLQLAEKRAFVAAHPGSELRLGYTEPNDFVVNSLHSAYYVVEAARTKQAPTVARLWQALEERTAVEGTTASPREDLDHCRSRLAVAASLVTNHAQARIEEHDRQHDAAKKAREIVEQRANHEALVAYRRGQTDTLPPGVTHEQALANYGNLEAATRNAPLTVKRALTATEKVVVGMLRKGSDQ